MLPLCCGGARSHRGDDNLTCRALHRALVIYHCGTSPACRNHLTRVLVVVLTTPESFSCP